MKTVFKYIFIVILAAVTAASVHGQTSAGVKTVSGTVTDSVSGRGVPFATVLLEGTETGGLTDEQGRFSIRFRGNITGVRVGVMGYQTKSLPVPPEVADAGLDIKLVPVGVTLDEVETKGRKSRYSKKDNPAVDFARRMREMAGKTDPRRHKDYHYDKYERISLALNEYSQPKADSLRGLDSKFAFVGEYVDTSEITGKPILNVAVREKGSEVLFHEGARCEIIDGLRSAGIDEVIDPESLRRFYDDVLGEVDIYDGDINLLQRRFVSPLSRIAPDFYKFFLTDTLTLDGDTCVELMFVPRNPAMSGFNGRVYVGLHDPSMAVRRIEMSVPKEINLNFVENLRITQDYAKAPDGSRLKLRDDLVLEARLAPGTPGIYARRVSNHTGHSFRPLPETDSIMAKGDEILLPGAAERDSMYWTQRRTMTISRGELRMDEMMGRLRAEKLFRFVENVIRIVSDGYVALGKSGLAYGPVTSSAGYNTLEGFRLRAGVITTSELSRRWFGAGYVAYGFRDRRWKYGAEVEYSFRDKDFTARDFPVHSLRLSTSFDMNWLGQNNEGADQEAVWFSLRFSPEIQMTYLRRQRLEYTLETASHLTLTARLEYQKQEATRYMTFVNGYGRAFPDFTLASATVMLRYAPGEKIFQTRMSRNVINHDSPVFTLSHTFAPKGRFGNTHAYSRTDFSITKRFWLSAFGYIGTRLSGGHVWTTSIYPLLLIPDANLSYFMGPSAFSCLNPVEFVNDSFLRLDLTYHAQGALLNLIPGVRQLKLREVVGFKGLAGHLSDRNRPSHHQSLFRFPEAAHTVDMSATPYMEAFVGLENILKIFRVDYVWRLTYRDVPYACKGGVRIAVSLRF